MLEQYKILKYKHSNESCVNTDSGKSLTIISNLLLLPVDNKIIRVSPSLATQQGNENVAHEPLSRIGGLQLCKKYLKVKYKKRPQLVS